MNTIEQQAHRIQNDPFGAWLWWRICHPELCEFSFPGEEIRCGCLLVPKNAAVIGLPRKATDINRVVGVAIKPGAPLREDTVDFRYISRIAEKHLWVRQYGPEPIPGQAVYVRYEGNEHQQRGAAYPEGKGCGRLPNAVFSGRIALKLKAQDHNFCEVIFR